MDSNNYYHPSGSAVGGMPYAGGGGGGMQSSGYGYQPSGYGSSGSSGLFGAAPMMGGQGGAQPQMHHYNSALQQQQQQQMPGGVYLNPPQPSLPSLPSPSAGPTQSLFGVVLPGRPCITQFEVVGNSKAVCTIENPMLFPDLVFFLLPGTNNIPPGHGALIYYSVTPFTNWILLGSVSPDKPSGSFRTGWTTNEELIGHQYIQLGIALERLDTIQNLEGRSGGSGVEDRFAIAHKIAMDLFRFTNSFCEASQGGMMLVPTSIFDKWMERFEAKYRLDPNFMLKSAASDLDA